MILNGSSRAKNIITDDDNLQKTTSRTSFRMTPVTSNEMLVESVRSIAGFIVTTVLR